MSFFSRNDSVARSARCASARQALSRHGKLPVHPGRLRRAHLRAIPARPSVAVGDERGGLDSHRHRPLRVPRRHVLHEFPLPDHQPAELPHSRVLLAIAQVCADEPSRVGLLARVGEVLTRREGQVLECHRSDGTGGILAIDVQSTG